ncbi:transporter substrate-binding and LysM peptidoglycan-binding domain-containing protein [Leptothrix sp. BB-4]
MKLKPVPRLILIIAVVCAGVYGAMRLTADPGHETASSHSSSPGQTQANATPATSAPSAQIGQVGATLKSMLAQGVVRVGVQSPSEPFFAVTNGQGKGFNVDFMKLLFAQSEFQSTRGAIDINTEFRVDTYEEVPQTLLKRDQRGHPVVDMAIDGLTFSDGDLPGVTYTIPYVDDFGYALIGLASGSIRSLQDVSKASIGILKGDPDVRNYMQSQFPGARLVEISDASTSGSGARDWINKAITRGSVDAVVYDYPFAVAELRGTELQFLSAKLPNSRLQYKIGVRKEDGDLLDRLNTAIRKVRASEAYGDLIRLHFGSNKIAKAKGAANGEGSHVVKTGDTLSRIAGAQLGDVMRYPEIEARNNLPNPNMIRVGQVLVIPRP